MPSPESADGPRHLPVPPDRDGQRIDNFLCTQLKGVPKSLLYRLLRQGRIRVDGKRVKPDARLLAGQSVALPALRDATRAQVAVDPRRYGWLEQRVIAEDRDFLVLDKPSGLATHGGSGVAVGVIEALRSLRPEANLELVHRLDRDTSGVLLIAKQRAALRALHAAIGAGAVEKRYLCLMAGRLPRARMYADAPLRKNTLAGGERVVRVDRDAGKAALTEFRVQERYPQACLVEARLHTGRTHQIRVHAASLGHPLAGDPKYGAAEFNAAMRRFGLRRLFLHAQSFAFEFDGAARLYSAPLPEDLKAVLAALAPAAQHRAGA